jgi:hypothetical protein
MTATVHPAPSGWARAHRALLALVVVVLALAAALVVLTVRLTTSSPSAPAAVPGTVLPVTDAGCASARTGAPC